METLSIKNYLVVKNGWIFSPRFDFFYFYLPFLLGWVILLFNYYYNLGNVYILDKSTFILLFAFATFMDTGHILSTISQVYLDKDERIKYKRALIIAPIIFFTLNISIYVVFGMKYVLYFFGYFNYYHTVKQQYGWMAYSTRRSNFYLRNDFLFDKFFIYAVMIIPFVWAHFSLGGTENRNAVMFFGDNQVVANFLKYLFIIMVIVFLIKQIVMVVLYKTINFNKLLLLVTTMIAWGAIIFLRSPFSIFITSIMHSIPYLALIYFFGEKQAKTRQRKSLLFASAFSFILFPVIIFLCGLFYTHLLRFLADINGKKIITPVFGALSILFSVVFFMHYYLDGIIWKRRNFKPELM